MSGNGVLGAGDKGIRRQVRTKAMLLIKAPCVESVGIFSFDSPSLIRKRWT
jgi:hypothetical protein